ATSVCFFFSSRRRHTRSKRDWSSDVCSSDLNAGVDFVKTSTGFGPGAATIEAVEIMRKTVGADIGVKASGGVRDRAAAEAMIAAGATRIGASAGIAIVTGVTGEGDY